MSLGNVGHHVSVFNIEGKDGRKSPHIVNTCLAYIHSHFKCRDKFYIREKVCTVFTLEQIKAAREILYVTHEPEVKYSYRGPNSKNGSGRDKVHDAFEGIYIKMSKLDAAGCVPVFSVPSVELLDFMSSLKEFEHSTCEERFQKMEERSNKMEKDMQDIYSTFKSFVAISTSGTSNPSFPSRSQTDFSRSIPPSTRNRLISNASKRSASELSQDEIVIPSDLASEDDDAFVLPRAQRKKLRRGSKNKSPAKKINPSVGDNSKINPMSYSQMASKKPKPPATKGTVKSTATFRCAVADVFLFNCHVNCTEDDVRNHYDSCGIKVRKVEKKSHNLSARSSFKVSPESKDDYDKMLAPEYIPEDVCARKYIYRRGPVNAERKEAFLSNGLSSATRDLLTELDAMDPSRESMDIEREASQTSTQNGSK